MDMDKLSLIDTKNLISIFLLRIVLVLTCLRRVCNIFIRNLSIFTYHCVMTQWYVKILRLRIKSILHTIVSCKNTKITNKNVTNTPQTGKHQNYPQQKKWKLGFSSASVCIIYSR